MTKKFAIIVAVVWFAILGGSIAKYETTLRQGTEAVLQTIPVDPRDLFRGDYVTLEYEISQLTDKPGAYENGQVVYVTLDPVEIYAQKPTDQLFIKGRVEYWFEHQTFDVTDTPEATYYIDYGIEKYFVPEGEGLAIERNTTSDIDTVVSIDKNGNATIKHLLIDGEKLEF